MNTVNQTFNWSRFTATFRKEILENKRALLFTLVSIYGLLTMLMIIGNLVSTIGGGESMAEMTDMKTPQIMVISFLSFALTISASLSFKSLTTKKGRTSLFTSPSSTLEKFLVNLLIYVVGMFVAYFACAQLADLTRIAALCAFKSESFIVPGPINFLTGFNDLVSSKAFMAGDFDTVFAGNKGWVFVISVLASGGLYFMGSVLWPRLSFLKTFAATYAFEACVFIIAAPLFYFFGDMEAFGKWMLDFIGAGGFSMTMIIWSIVMAVVCYGLAWFLFKRKDVVSLKWWK